MRLLLSFRSMNYSQLCVCFRSCSSIYFLVVLFVSSSNLQNCLHGWMINCTPKGVLQFSRAPSLWNSLFYVCLPCNFCLGFSLLISKLLLFNLDSPECYLWNCSQCAWAWKLSTCSNWVNDMAHLLCPSCPSDHRAELLIAQCLFNQGWKGPVLGKF